MSSTHRVTSFAARSHFMSAEGSSGAPQERRRSKGRLRKARNQHRGTLVPHKVQAHFASQQTSPGGTVRPSTAQTASGLTSNPAAGTLRGGVGNSLRHPQHRNRGKRSVGLPAAPFVYSYNPRDFSSCISGQTVGKPTASTSALRPRDSSADFGDHPQQPGLNQQQHLPNLGQSSARELLNTVFRDNTWLPAERAELKNSLSNFNHDSRTTARQNPTGSGGMLFANARAGQLATIVNSQNNPSSLTHRIGPRPATAQTARAGFPASAQAQTQSDSREVDPGIAGVDSPGDATGSKLERKAPERGNVLVRSQSHRVMAEIDSDKVSRPSRHPLHNRHNRSMHKYSSSGTLLSSRSRGGRSLDATGIDDSSRPDTPEFNNLLSAWEETVDHVGPWCYE